MGEIGLINSVIFCADMCKSLDSKRVGVDGLISYMYCSVADNIFISEDTTGDDTRFCRVANSGVGCSDTSLFGDISNSFILESDHPIEEANNIFFRLGDIHMLSHLINILHLLDMK